MTPPQPEGLGSGRLCTWELWTIYRFSGLVALFLDQFGHPRPIYSQEGGLVGKREQIGSSRKKSRYKGKRDQTGKIRTRSTSSRGGNGWRCDLFSIYPCPTDYARPLGFGRPRPLCVGAIHDLLIFRTSRRPFWSWHVHRTAPPCPARPAARWIFTYFHSFLFTFREGNIGGSKGGYHEFGRGENFEKHQTARRLIPSYPWGVGSM